MSDGLIAHVLDLLSGWSGVSARRMFSGHGLFQRGVMFGLVIRDVLYLRVDERNRAEFEAAGSRPFSYRRGPHKEIEIRSYLEAPPALFDDPDEMRRWATASAAAALAAKTPKPRQTKKKPATRRRRSKITKN